MKIGVVSSFKQNDSIWKNGIAQNTLMLYDVLSAIDIVERVSLLNIGANIDPYKEYYLDGYNFITMDGKNLKQIRDNYDLIITLGAIPPSDWMDFFKQKKNNKIVFYKGGNTFVNQIESIIYGAIKGWPNVDISSKKMQEAYYNVDEIWMVPQQEFHNKDYYEITYRTQSRVVPFVWSPKFLIKSAEIIKTTNQGAEPLFDNKKFEKWRAVSFEPNMSVLKNMLPIINFAEYAYRSMTDQQKDQFEKLIITNGNGHLKDQQLISSIKTMDIFNDKKLSFDGRYPIVYVLSKFSEMVLSHQWGNALNYAYLDICYFGIPLIHNAHLCKDLGYYYEDWKLKDASSLIIKVMEERKSDESYTNRQRAILQRYTTENKEMLESYKKLLLNLWSNEIKETRYDWKNNTVS